MKNKATNTAKEYPAKPIVMIVPLSGGGTFDLLARTMVKAAVKHLGQRLIVKNIPGGGGTFAWNELAKAKSDGYTIGITGIGVILHPMYDSANYHYPTALEPLTQVIQVPLAAIVLSDQPWKSMNDIVKYAKQYPGEMKFGNLGLGSPRHIVGEMLAKYANLKFAQVHFPGEVESLTALLDGQVQLILINASLIKEYVKSGKIRVLAVASEKRLAEPEFENVPIFLEQGLEIVFDGWAGIGAPKGLPAEEKNKLQEGLKAIIHDPEFQRDLQELGMTVAYMGPREFSAKWVAENRRFAKIMKETGIAERIMAQKNGK